MANGNKLFQSLRFSVAWFMSCMGKFGGKGVRETAGIAWEARGGTGIKSSFAL